MDLLDLFKEYKIFLNFSFFHITDIIECLIIILIFYYLIIHFKNTRIWILIKGILVIFLLYLVAVTCSLSIIKYLFEALFGVLFVSLIIIFQPEIRKTLENIGNRSFKFRKNKSEERYSEKNIDEIVKACSRMSSAKTGALILIERDIPLFEYEETGIAINSDISNQLITNIFEKNTPLHDGAMIIKDNKISYATCYLPLSENKKIDKNLGTRHRAGIGASEDTDALVIMVSEETGAISYSIDGKIVHDVSENTLREILEMYKSTKEKTKKKSLSKKVNNIFYSIFFGFAIWSILCIVINPITKTTIKDIPVDVVNDNVIMENNTYEIKSGETVDITVSGRKTDIVKLTSSDFIATADFNNLSIANSVIIDVDTDIENIQIDTHNALMQIKTEEAVTVDCPITIIKEGTERDGFFVYDITSSTKSIKITGPKNTLNTLDSAHAIVNVDDVYSSTNKTVDLIIYDKNGNLMNLKNCKLSAEKILVNLKTYNTKSIPFKINIINSDTMSADIVEESISFDRVKIATNGENFKNINEFNIDLKLEDFDLTSSQIDSTINLNDYTPDDVYIVDNNELDIKLTLKLYKIEDFIIKSSDITIEGDSDYKITNENVTVKVKYDLDTINEMKVSFLEPKINTNNVDSDGNVKIEFKEDPAITILTNPTVVIEKEKK